MPRPPKTVKSLLCSCGAGKDKNNFYNNDRIITKEEHEKGIKET
jgi:hypothetical protein